MLEKKANAMQMLRSAKGKKPATRLNDSNEAKK
jgi:hypothetical protein